MPVFDVFFTQSPAQVDFTPVSEMWEIDQADVGVLDLAPGSSQLAQSGTKNEQKLDVLSSGGTSGVAVPVCRQSLRRQAMLLQLRSCRNHSASQFPYDRQDFACFSYREETFFHEETIIAKTMSLLEIRFILSPARFLRFVMKCLVCDSKKGKRFCPAKDGLICAQCCGEKRVIEINCPPDCSYLVTGQSHQNEKHFVAQLTAERDPLRRKKLIQVSRQWAGFLFLLQQEIVQYARDVRSLRDSTIKEAVRLLRKTLETERKGLIYEHSSPDPLIQSLSHDLKRGVDKIREDAEGPFHGIRLEAILNCLDVLEMEIDFHLLEEPSGAGYLQFIRRNHPGTSGRENSSGLILP